MNLSHLSASVFLSLLVTGCFGGSQTTLLLADPAKTVVLEFGDPVALTAGEIASISPTRLQVPEGLSVHCSAIDELPDWVKLNESECSIRVAARHIGDWSYRIVIQALGQEVTSFVRFSVSAPDPAILPNPAHPVSQAKYYMTETLASDSNYIATFDPSTMYFLNATNPYQPDVVAKVNVNTRSAGMPQALASIDDRFFVVTDKGYLLSYDWSDKLNPNLTATLKIGNGGQNYDIATNSKDLVFIANTDYNRFAIVDVSSPTSPVTIYTDDTLGGYGAGVTFSNDRAYVTAYQGKIMTYAANSNGNWARVSSVDTSFAGIHRPFATQDKLFVPKYGGDQVDVFSLSNPETPVLLETLTLSENMSSYARPLVQDGILYLFTSGNPVTNDNQGKVLTYKIPKAQGALIPSQVITPPCPGGASCSAVYGATLFHGGSFLSFIGVDPLNASKRNVITSPLNLQF